MLDIVFADQPKRWCTTALQARWTALHGDRWVSRSDWDCAVWFQILFVLDFKSMSFRQIWGCRLWVFSVDKHVNLTKTELKPQYIEINEFDSYATGSWSLHFSVKGVISKGFVVIFIHEIIVQTVANSLYSWSSTEYWIGTWIYFEYLIGTWWYIEHWIGTWSHALHIGLVNCTWSDIEFWIDK